MAPFKKIAAVGCTLCILVLTACGTAHVKPEDRDTSGTYDGVWVGEVAGPRASTVILPGNWTMSCEWKPYRIYVIIDDGRVQLGKLEGKSAISKAGKFRYDLTSGDAKMHGGIMPGNGKFVQTFSGSLSGANPQGVYRQYSTSLGGSGCTSKIQFQKLDNTEA